MNLDYTDISNSFSLLRLPLSVQHHRCYPTIDIAHIIGVKDDFPILVACPKKFDDL